MKRAQEEVECCMMAMNISSKKKRMQSYPIGNFHTYTYLFILCVYILMD